MNSSLPQVPKSALFLLLLACSAAAQETQLPPLPAGAKLALEEDWSSGKIDPARWYLPRKKWGQGNNGVAPENVAIARDRVNGKEQPVLVCTAHGDLYDGPLQGYEGERSRVGGLVVSREFFASGRFEVIMKIGGAAKAEGGPEDPTRPKGAVPAVWTYGYRYVSVPKEGMDAFHATEPLYNPNLKAYGEGANEYWSELDFPEFGKGGDFDKAMYNTFLQNKHQPRTFEVKPMIDGQYHTLTTEWRTKLVPIDGVTDAQVAEKDGFHWVQDKAIPFNRYLGNPLKRLGKDRYAIYSGDRATHYLDGKKVGENPTFVPSMAAQLNLGIWLPGWGGPAPWKQSSASFASVKIWQYNDEGDVRGVITENITDNYAADGSALKK
ncbi:glycoside hydrolase family 16 protein [Haloferula sp. BvORR071]|uniref:glycoside hydrolase family 16 protein n=1 Tax=Haloferula sp. BvORR071 TaxID=1396141 RepID=UPI00069799F5|nr:glycoside hydrolase family 16 protein [Haloferula sp. BvORR071]